MVDLRDVHVREGLAVLALHVVRGEQVHRLVVLRELEGDVGDDHAEGEGLDADLLVGVLALGVQEAQDVRVVGVEVHRTGALAGPELVGVGEGVLEQLHHGDDAAGLVLDVLDRRAVLAQVAQQQRDAAAALGQLQRGVDGAADGLHVVLDAQQEAAHELSALGLAGIEEGGGGRLEAAVEDLVDEVAGELLVAAGEGQGDHHHAVLEALEVPLAVEGLQRVRGVVLERAEEGGEAELLREGLLGERLDEGELVLLEHLRLVVVVLDQVVHLLAQRVEEHRVGVHVLQEVLPRGLAVLVELDPAVRTVQVQHRVQRVVVEPPVVLDRGHLGQCRQNSSNPSWTRVTSRGVPNSSNLYMWGTWHLAEMMSPAKQ